HEPEGAWERKFLTTVKLVARIRVITHLRARPTWRPTPRPQRASASAAGGVVKILAIGASTGGPGAVVEVLRGLPIELNVPVLFVLHINPQFSHALADWLGQQTAWPARFANDREPAMAAAGQVIIAP